jgi:hypothetical protein
MVSSGMWRSPSLAKVRPLRLVRSAKMAHSDAGLALIHAPCSVLLKP